MATGTRTAPDLTGAASRKLLTCRYIDHTGDKRSVTVEVDQALVDNVDFEDLVANNQLMSNASLYEAHISEVWAGAALATNGQVNVWENVSDNVVLQLKNPVTNASVRNYAPAPTNTVFEANSDSIDVANATFLAWKGASLAAMGAASLTAIGVRFSHRVDINPQQAL